MMQRRLDRLSSLLDVTRPDSHYDVRIFNWQAALDQWRESPMVGTGAGTHLYYGRQFRRPELQPDPEHAHSDYLELLAEYGIIGGIGMAAFLVAHLGRGMCSYRELAARRKEELYRPSYELAVNVGAMTAVSAYLAHSVVDFNLHLPGNALLFAFIFGLLANEGCASDEPDIHDSPKQGWRRFVLPVFGFLFALHILQKIPTEYLSEKARVAVRDGRLDDAIAFANRGLLTEKQNPFLYYHLGEAHRLAGANGARSSRMVELEKSTQAYRAGIAIFPQDEDLWVRLGQSLDGMSKYSEARKAYEKAISLDPNLGILYGYYARHLQITGREAEASAALERGESLTSKSLNEFVNQASSLDDASDKK